MSFPILFRHRRRRSGLILDTVSGAVAAWSVRKLRNAYAGNCLRVRRVSDSVEQDIGFLGNDLDTASLTTFAAGGSVLVVTWYDQSGNGKDLTQATAAAQPQIVSSGSVLTGSNSKPILRHNGTTSTMASPGTIGLTDRGLLSTIYLSKNTGGTAERFSVNIRSSTPPGGYYGYRAGGANRMQLASKTATFVAPSDFEIHGAIANGSDANAYRNGGSNVLTTGTFAAAAATGATAWTGAEAGTANFSNVEIHEWVIWATGLTSAQLNAVGNDLETYYSVTWTDVS